MFVSLGQLRHLIRETLYLDQVYSDNEGEWKVGDILVWAETHAPMIEFNVEELAKLAFMPSPNEDFNETPGSPEFVARAERSDLRYPIVVVRYPDGDFIADGNHRLWKAYSRGMQTINGFLMSADELHLLPRLRG